MRSDVRAIAFVPACDRSDLTPVAPWSIPPIEEPPENSTHLEASCVDIGQQTINRQLQDVGFHGYELSHPHEVAVAQLAQGPRADKERHTPDPAMAQTCFRQIRSPADQRRQCDARARPGLGPYYSACTPGDRFGCRSRTLPQPRKRFGRPGRRLVDPVAGRRPRVRASCPRAVKV